MAPSVFRTDLKDLLQRAEFFAPTQVVIIFLSQVPLTEIPRPVGAVNDLAERNFFQWQISWKRRLLQTGAGWYRTAVWLGNTRSDERRVGKECVIQCRSRC